MVAYDQPIILTLTIPTGATTGERIVIDGVNGVIDVYDNNNDKTVEIGEGVIQVGFSPNSAIVLTASGEDPFGNPTSTILFETFNTTAAASASIGVGHDVAGLGEDFFGITGPAQSTVPGFWEIDMVSGSNSVPPFIFVPTLYILYHTDNNPEGGVQVVQAFNNAFTKTLGSAIPAIAIDSGWPIVSDQVWSNVPLVNSWANVGGAFQIAEYRLMADGTVMMHGSVTGGTSTTVATLPVGYRPLGTVQFAVGGGATVAAGASLRVGITAAGVVTISGESIVGGGFAFDGVRFSVI